MLESATHIWCDGSYRQAHRAAGAGWRIRWPDRSETEDCRPIPLRDSFNHGSTIAELEAFSCALEQVEAGSSVHVHTDCLTLIDFMEKRRLPAKAAREAPSLVRAFERAVAQVDRLGGNVILEKAADRNNENLLAAHRLSQAASSPHGRPRRG